MRSEHNNIIMDLALYKINILVLLLLLYTRAKIKFLDQGVSRVNFWIVFFRGNKNQGGNLGF